MFVCMPQKKVQEFSSNNLSSLDDMNIHIDLHTVNKIYKL